MKKIYKIRHKATGEFIALGYSRKASWLVYPHAAIANDYRHEIRKHPADYEVVVYELVETRVEPVKIK